MSGNARLAESVDLLSLSTQDLVRVCIETGESAAWEEFIVRTRPALVAALRRACGRNQKDFAEIDDFLQDIYIKLCQNRGAALSKLLGQSEGMLYAYFRVVALNVVNDSIRRRTAARRGGGKVTALIDDERAIQSQPSAVEHTLLLKEIDQILARDEESRGERNRRIFWLYYRQGFTSKAIASLPGMELSAKGIEAVLQRLTKVVRHELVTRVGPKLEGFRPASALSKEDDK